MYRLRENSNFFRLYSTLLNWNNNPLFNKDRFNLNLFETTVKNLRGPVTSDMLAEVRGLNWNGEKDIDHIKDVAVEIDNMDFKKLFKMGQLNTRNSQFFTLMSNCFKNWLFHNSGLQGMETLANIDKLLDPHFFMII